MGWVPSGEVMMVEVDEVEESGHVGWHLEHLAPQMRGCSQEILLPLEWKWESHSKRMRSFQNSRIPLVIESIAWKPAIWSISMRWRFLVWNQCWVCPCEASLEAPVWVVRSLDSRKKSSFLKLIFWLVRDWSGPSPCSMGGFFGDHGRSWLSQYPKSRGSLGRFSRVISNI